MARLSDCSLVAVDANIVMPQISAGADQAGGVAS